VRLSFYKQLAILFTRWQWALLLLAAPFFIFPSVERRLGLLLVPILWLLAWWFTKKPLLNTPFNLPLLLLTLMMLISLFATYDVSVSLPKIAGVIFGLGLFYAFLYSVRSEKSILITLVVFMLAGLGIAGLGLLGMKWVDKYPFLSKYMALLPILIKGLPGAEAGFNPNEVAGALLWVIPLLFVSMVLTLFQLKNWAHIPRRGWLVTGVVFLSFVNLFAIGVLLLTQSRTGLIALVVSFLISGMMLLSKRMRLVYLAALVILGVSLGYFGLKSGWANKLYAATGNPGTSITTFSGRVEIWNRAIYGIQDFPLTGMGMNTFRYVVYVLYPLNNTESGVDFGHAHNEFLQVALDLGLPGLIAFLSLYLVAFWMLVQTWIWAKEPAQLSDSRSISSILASSRGVKALALGLGGGLMAHAFYGLTDVVALGAKPGVLFWMLLGLVAGLYQEQRKLREQEIT
jgi:putative inorganic carbon (HCO3(-)) transporter